MTLDDMIAEVEKAGLRVITPRDTPDDRLRELWEQIQKLLRMARGIAEDGAKLPVEHPAWLNRNADAARLLRDHAVGAIDAIFENAVVERREQDAAD